MTYGILPTLICLLAVVRVVLDNERINARERQLLVRSGGYGLDNQLGVAVRRLLVMIVAGCGGRLEQLLLQMEHNTFKIYLILLKYLTYRVVVTVVVVIIGLILDESLTWTSRTTVGSAYCTYKKGIPFYYKRKS